MPQSVTLKLTKNDSKQSVKSQCHLAASVENIVSQLILVFTTLPSTPILIQTYNRISLNPFYGISEFLTIATCNPHRIHININKFALFNYYTCTCSELHWIFTFHLVQLHSSEAHYDHHWHSPDTSDYQNVTVSVPEHSFTCSNLLCKNKLHESLTPVNVCWNSKTTVLMGFTVSLLHAGCIVIGHRINLRVVCWVGFFGFGKTACYPLMTVTNACWLRRYRFIEYNDGGIQHVGG